MDFFYALSSFPDLDSVGTEAGTDQDSNLEVDPLEMGGQRAGRTLPGLGGVRSDSPVCDRGFAALFRLERTLTRLGV